MKRAAPAPIEPEPRSGPPLTVIAGVAGLILGSFLLLGPGCEREADASVLGAPGADQAQVERAVLRLCASQKGRDQMAARLDELPRAERVPVLELASGQPRCLLNIPGRLRAERELWNDPAVADAIAAVGADAIEPALVTIVESDGARRRAAITALVALHEKMSEDQKQRAIKRVEPLSTSEDAMDSGAARALLSALGVAPPAADAQDVEGDEDDGFQLGGGGLRLQLGGGAPPSGPPRGTGGGVRLQEPTLNLGAKRPKGGVLFDASKER